MKKVLNIAILGYGKMGKIIESIAIERGHKITFVANRQNADFTSDDLIKAKVDVAIEFSLPKSAVDNIKKCIATTPSSIPVAIGTTGWYNSLEEIKQLVEDKNGCILPATNFSVGVNLFFELNKKLAQLMNKQVQYEPTITEIHHTQKLDAPSGTAITTAQQIIEQLDKKTTWVKEQSQKESELIIKSERIENVPGTHDVVYESDIDTITLSHVAKNRKGFALGAVLAAEFIADKKGIYTMKDVLDI